MNQKKPKGLHVLKMVNDKLKISANARLLSGNYKQGFGLSTMDQFLDVLDKKCSLVLDHDFMKESSISKTHIKNDIKVTPEKLLNELMLIGYWSKYERIRRENSITYENANKTTRQRTTVYGKLAEIQTNWNKYKGLGIDPIKFEGVSRIETKMDDWRTVKYNFGTRNMEYILNQKNVNGIIMANILKGQPERIDKADLGQFKSLNDEKDFYHVKGLCDRFNGDVKAIKAHIRTKTSYPKHQYQKIDKYLPMVKAKNGCNLFAIKQMHQQLKRC